MEPVATERGRERVVCVCVNKPGSHSLQGMASHREGCVGDAGLGCMS